MADHANDDLVAHLIQLHAAEKLRSYRGNLLAVVHAVESNWVPVENAPGVPEFVGILRKHLAANGNSENDSFLLRFGLTVPGRHRGIVPPLMVLEENRGGFSARRQREAEGQIRQLAEALVIGRFFFPKLAADSEQAVIELADRCERLHTASDAEVLSQFRELSAIQAGQLAAEAMRCIDAAEEPLVDVGTRILRRLACFRDSGLNEATCNALITRDILWPSILYRDASESVAGQLVEMIEGEPDQFTLNHLLLALAWTRSETAVQAFRNWFQHAPRWAESLRVPPEEYLPAAGWRLDEAGVRRDLVSTDCFRLIRASESATANVDCRTALSDNCPSCGGPQGLLFDFAKATEDYFSSALAEAPRRVLCCLHCSCYGTVFTRYHPDGTAEWLSPIAPSAFAYDYSREPCHRTIDGSPFLPFACAEPFDLSDASTLGGIPMWLQEAEFPRCVDCGQLMTFLAQHDNGPREEGIYYAFFCAECRVAAVTYQQT